MVDLHIHTYYSDGTFTPEEVVKEAKQKGVRVVAITDHNCILGWEEFKTCALQEGLMPIKGVEINCKYKNQILHLLAYGFQDTKMLIQLINEADDKMQQMSIDLVQQLSKQDKRGSIEDFKKYSYDRRLGGWKGIHYLLDKGITKKLFDGFRYYSEYGCDFSLYDFPQLHTVCQAIKAAGGYSVLAHPAEYYKTLDEKQLWKVLEALKEEGIQGIECYYPTHTKELTTTCVKFCETYHLLITAGSDEHGDFGKQAKTLKQTIGCMQKKEHEVYLGNLLESYK